MDTKEFMAKYNGIAVKENYIPFRGAFRIGKFSADVYRRGFWVAKLEDEGYTKVLVDYEAGKRYAYTWDNEIHETSVKCLTLQELFDIL